MSVLVVDLEANGLLDTVTKIHCICMTDYITGDRTAFITDRVQDSWHIFDNEDTTIIGHNFIDYDLAALKKVLNFDFKGKVIDTMIISQYLFPERVGGHSLEAWGERLHFPKQEHDEWDVFTPEMLHRCKTDVELTRRVFDTLMKELGAGEENIEGVRVGEYKI